MIAGMPRRIAFCGKRHCMGTVLSIATGWRVYIEDRSADPRYRCECGARALWCIVKLEMP